jgi:hypothetical protein
MEDLPEGSYKGYPLIEKDPESYEKILKEICPELYDPKLAHSIVSLSS